MKTRSNYRRERLPLLEGYYMDAKRSRYPTQPPLLDQTMEEPPLRDQTMEEPPLHDQPDHKIDDGYASSPVSVVYSSEALSDYTESDDEFTDQEFTGQGASSSSKQVSIIATRSPYRPARVVVTMEDPSHNDQTVEEPPLHDQQPDHEIDDDGYFVYSSEYTSEAVSYESDYTQSDEEFTTSSSKQVSITPAPKPAPVTESSSANSSAGDSWKKSWPKEGTETESARVHVFGFYRERTRCGGYAIILRNTFAQPIAARVKVSPDGKSHIYQVLAGLEAGILLAADHGCSTPLMRCNSSMAVKLMRQVAPYSCRCQGSKLSSNLCYKCACSFFPDLSDDCFETLVPLINKLLRHNLGYLVSVLRRSNKPAYYLAKQAKEEALVDGKVVGFEASKKPDEFPDELVSILMSDMHHSIYCKV